MCVNMPSMYIDILMLPPFPSFTGFCLGDFHQPFEPSLQVVNESKLESFFYEVVYDATSTINCSKEPFEAGVMDTPPPKQTLWHSMFPSTLKGIEHVCDCG